MTQIVSVVRYSQNLTVIVALGQLSTMTQQLRYHTLVNNIGKIYASESSVRTPLLQKGLDEIVGAIKPAEPEDWKRVKADSEKLLHVWNVKEASTASAAVVKMLTDMLNELSTVSMNH